MKVILISDVENIGVVGDVKEVKNGMAEELSFSSQARSKGNGNRTLRPGKAR